MKDYNHKKVEKKALKNINNIKSSNKKIYISMFPYPSGVMHMGHVRNYVINDVLCRKKKTKMFMGWDSFGLPAENFSIKRNKQPIVCIKENISKMKKQMKNLGFNVFWKREIITCDINFYKWTQYIFKEMFKNGYIYKNKVLVNWDPLDKTSLSNEQIINERGWRSGVKTEKKFLPVYLLKISKILKILIKEIKKSKWPDNIKKKQLKWIGEKKGFLFKNKKISIFISDNKKFKTLGVSVNNKIVKKIYKKNNYLKEKFKKLENIKKKKNFFFGYLKIKKKKIPLYISNKIKYEKYFHVIKIKKEEKNYVRGIKKKTLIELININNLSLKKKKKKIYKILDWNISRQRYWGTPIPIIKCLICGDSLSKIPVKLPLKKIPNGNVNLLERCKKFYKVKCPICKGPANRECDTLDTFFDSSWYYIYYNLDKVRKKNIYKNVDIYIGGIEHSILHLLYSRIFTIILEKIGFINNKIPFKNLIIQGLLLNKSFYYKFKNRKIWITTKKAIGNKVVKFNGIIKMSKSKNNGVSPKYYIKKYGADSLRLYILFLAPISKNIIWEDKKIIGCYRFIKKFWKTGFEIFNITDFKKCKISNIEDIENIEIKIKEHYKKKEFNVLISLLMKSLKIIRKNIFKLKEKYIKEKFKILLHNTYPICPFFTYVMWDKLGIKKKEGDIYKYKNKFFKRKIKNVYLLKINNKYKTKLKTKTKSFHEIIALCILKLKIKIKEIKKIYFITNKILNINVKKNNNKN